jgi:hypothetical protein
VSRWGTPLLPTTSAGPSCSENSKTERRGCWCVSDTATRSGCAASRRVVQVVSFVMTQKMLRGIRDSAERIAAPPPQSPTPDRP